MTALEFIGSRKPGHTSLYRRNSSGPRFTFIASLPNKTVEAVRLGGTLLIRLDESAKKNQNPWTLDVILNNKTYKGTSLSHSELQSLTWADDVIPVRIEGGQITLRKYDLLLARYALEQARAAVKRGEKRVSALETEIVEMSRPKEIRIGTADEKYEVVLIENGKGGLDAYATRNGERWRDLTEAPLTVALARELKGCRDAITALGGDPLTPGRTPDHYGAERDLLRLTLTDGSELVQDAEGRFTATRDGSEVPGLTGDKLTLTLAYELEGARAALAQLVPGLTTAPTPELTDREETPGF